MTMSNTPQPQDHAVTRALLGILQRTEVLLQRKLDQPASLQGLEVSESTWAEWEAAQAETA